MSMYSWSDHLGLKYPFPATYDAVTLDGTTEDGEVLETNVPWRKVWSSKEIDFGTPSQLKKVYTVNLSYHIPGAAYDYTLNQKTDEYYDIAVFFEYVDKHGIEHIVNLEEEDQPGPERWGCTDPDASNYDENATFDDGSCEYNFSPRGNSKIEGRGAISKDRNGNEIDETGFCGKLTKNSDVGDVADDMNHTFRAKIGKTVTSCKVLISFISFIIDKST